MKQASLMAGDKVRVKSGVSMPEHGWGYVRHDEVGKVTGYRDDGVLMVDFPSQKNWCAEPSEMEVVAKLAVKPRRKSPEKVLAYGVIEKDGSLYTSVDDRDLARYIKAELGGKQQGVTIVVLQAGKEIR